MTLCRRWYDREHICSKLLVQIRDMPQAELQEFCARMLIHFAERIRSEIKRPSVGDYGPSSMGASAISGMYRFGSEKRRWYDANSVVRKAVGILYTLPTEGLSALGFKLGDAFGMLQVYAQVCKHLDQPPDQQDLVRIATSVLVAGKGEAEAVLTEIVGPELYQAIRLMPPDAS